jgi:hypothetical protein
MESVIKTLTALLSNLFSDSSASETLMPFLQLTRILSPVPAHDLYFQNFHFSQCKYHLHSVFSKSEKKLLFERFRKKYFLEKFGGGTTLSS